MTLAAALTAYAELLADVLVNDCDASMPTRILRYHGGHVPEDIGCSDGLLSVWWEDPLEPLTLGREPCPGFPQVVLAARWAVCWKLADVDADGVTLFDDTWDLDAAVLADAAECVARALMRLACVVDPTDVKALALLALTMGRPPVLFISATPSPPSGGVATVEWRVRVGLRAETSGSS